MAPSTLFSRFTSAIARRRRPHRFVAALAALACSFAGTEALAAPQDGVDDTDSRFPLLGVLNADEVHVRCNASTSYYPFGRLKKGDLVVVMGEKFNWAKVALAGPAFGDRDQWFGYIKLSPEETGRFKVNGQNGLGRTFDRVNIVAPNLLYDRNPDNSWRAVHRLGPDIDVEILGTVPHDDETIYRVALPETAAGWINMEFIDPATPEQREQWDAWLRGERIVKNDDGATAADPDQAEGQGVLATDGGAAETPDIEKPEGTEAATGDTAENVADAAAAGTDDAATDTAQPNPDINDGTMAADPSQPTGAGELESSESGDVTMGEDNPATTTDAADTKEPATPKTPRDRLNDLEKAYRLMGVQDLEAREAAPLRDLYVALSKVDAEPGADSDAIRVAAYARARARQLTILMDLQQRRQELRAIHERLELAREETDAAKLSIQSSGQYVAVGRLAVSTVYDGNRLPRLLRVQDPGTGRTIAYLRPDDRMDYVGMLGQLIGVMGDRNFDEVTGLSLIRPNRIDILAAR